MTRKMFPFITQTWNPLAGECLHKCSYCWARTLEAKYPTLKEKYCGQPRIIQKELNRIHSFKETDFIFVCDMTDLFGHWVPDEFIELILSYLRSSPAQFLLLTKNPARYKNFQIPENCVCGATIESDIDHELTGPPERTRIIAMVRLNHRKMVSVEPVMNFTPDFPTTLLNMGLSFVAVGYDNYNHGLDEPELEDVEAMIHGFENRGITVYRKTLREKIQTVDNISSVVSSGNRVPPSHRVETARSTVELTLPTLPAKEAQINGNNLSKEGKQE